MVSKVDKSHWMYSHRELCRLCLEPHPEIKLSSLSLAISGEIPHWLVANSKFVCRVAMKFSRGQGCSVSQQYLGLFSLESRGKHVNLIPARNYMEESFREDQIKLFLEKKDGKTRSNGLMLCLKWFGSVIIKKKNSYWKVGTDWNGLSTESVESPSLRDSRLS